MANLLEKKRSFDMGTERAPMVKGWPCFGKTRNQGKLLKLVGLLAIAGFAFCLIDRQGSSSIVQIHVSNSTIDGSSSLNTTQTVNDSDLERGSVLGPKSEAFFEREKLRRRLDFEIGENFRYLMSEREKMNTPLYDRQLHLLARSMDLRDADSTWRRANLRELTRKLQAKIDQLQNPVECSRARYLIYPMKTVCGLGCRLHQVIFSFTVAFGENRTLILENDGEWGYSRFGWRKSYRPLSNCAYKDAINDETIYPYELNSPHRLLKYREIQDLRVDQRSAFLPRAIPDQLAAQIIHLHSNPPAYFVGQFMHYATRPNVELAEIVRGLEEKTRFDQGAIVGMHVRQTDKIEEAPYHPIAQYMRAAEIWFRIEEIRQQKSLPRRVFLATDERAISEEIHEKYKDWEIVENFANFTGSSRPGTRYSDLGLLGIASALEVLSRCQYFVGTFSSNIGRVVFELMQARDGDGDSAHSLDLAWYVHGENDHEQKAIEDHSPEGAGEIELRKGDTIAILDPWRTGGSLGGNGFSRGTNRRTAQSGIYPSYKVEEQWKRVDFSVLDEL